MQLFLFIIVILCVSASTNASVITERTEWTQIGNFVIQSVKNGRQINLWEEYPALKEAFQSVSNASASLFGNPEQFKSQIILLNDKFGLWLQSAIEGAKSMVDDLPGTLEAMRDSYNETLVTYAQNLNTLGSIYKKSVKGNEWYGLSLFVNNCELNAVYDYPTRIKDDLLSDDSRTIRRQILQKSDADQYGHYVKFAIPLFYNALKYQAMCKAIRNETVNDTVIMSQDEIQTVSTAILDQVKLDLATLSKDYFKRAVEDAKKEIIEMGGITRDTCKNIYKRLKANYAYANWTVAVYCNGCKDTRLVPEYYKTSSDVVLGKEYVFKGDGGKENYLQMWAEGKQIVLLTSAAGGRHSRDDWKDRMSVCVDAVEKTKIVSTLFEADNEKRIKNFKACVERLKVSTFSMIGILDTGVTGCMHYDLTESVVKLLLDKYIIFAVDKMRA